MKHAKRIIATTLMMATLTTPAMAIKTSAKPIRVSSYKGSTLKVGERSGLIIGPSDTDYSVTSSSPDTVAVEQVLTFWVAVAKGSGTAEITASNSAGDCGSVTLTVGSATTIASEAPTNKGQHRPDGQPGGTARDDPAHQPDPKGQWGVGAAGQR